MQTKECNKCGEIKSIEKFGKSKDCKYGVRGECKICIKKYSKIYYKENKKDILKRNKQYRLNNEKYIKELKKEYYINNKEELLEYHLLYRSNNKNKISKERGKIYNRNKKYIWNIKLKSPCKCGESHPECLDFHHIDQKTKRSTICKLTSRGYSLEIIQKEIDKCEIICSNCHREKHFKNKSIGNNKKKSYIKKIKEKSKCKCCKKRDMAYLVFHHINMNDKIEGINEMSNYKKYSLEDIKDEIKKCDILCENCHRKLHYKLRQEELNE